MGYAKGPGIEGFPWWLSIRRISNHYQYVQNWLPSSSFSPNWDDESQLPARIDISRLMTSRTWLRGAGFNEAGAEKKPGVPRERYYRPSETEREGAREQLPGWTKRELWQCIISGGRKKPGGYPKGGPIKIIASFRRVPPGWNLQATERNTRITPSRRV